MLLAFIFLQSKASAMATARQAACLIGNKILHSEGGIKVSNGLLAQYRHDAIDSN
jgi:hypothetical protein